MGAYVMEYPHCTGCQTVWTDKKIKYCPHCGSKISTYVSVDRKTIYIYK